MKAEVVEYTAANFVAFLDINDLLDTKKVREKVGVCIGRPEERQFDK